MALARLEMGVPGVTNGDLRGHRFRVPDCIRNHLGTALAAGQPLSSPGDISPIGDCSQPQSLLDPKGRPKGVKGSDQLHEDRNQNEKPKKCMGVQRKSSLHL